MREEEQSADPLTRPRSMAPARLKKRAEFLHAAGGRKSHAALFTVQARRRSEPQGGPRVGLTVTKKVGNAVERNRIKRRLRETMRLRADLGFVDGHDYVIVARRPLLSVTFPAIGVGLRATIARAQGDGGGRDKRPRGPQPRS